MAVKLIMTAKQMQNKDAWLKLRTKYIGGSDAATVVQMNPWKSAVTLWMEKTGEQEPVNLDDNMRVQFGSYAEEFVARWFTVS